MSRQSEAVAMALDNELDYTRLLISLMRSQPALVLDILQPNLDRFASELLKRDPEVFIALCQEQISGLKRIREVGEQLKSNSLIDAIKTLRADTGLGLKEAKDVVVAARDALVALGKLVSTTSRPGTSINTTITLSPTLQRMCDVLVGSFVP